MIVGITLIEKQIEEITASHGCTLYGFAGHVFAQAKY